MTRNLATARFYALVQQLALEERATKEHGWKARVARRIGAHPSYVSKIAGDEIENVGADVWMRAANNVGIDHAFFTDHNASEQYTAHLGRNVSRARPDRQPSTILRFDPLVEQAAQLIVADVLDAKTIRAAEKIAAEVLAMPAVHYAQELLEAEDEVARRRAAKQLILNLVLSVYSADAFDAVVRMKSRFTEDLISDEAKRSGVPREELERAMTESPRAKKSSE